MASYRLVFKRSVARDLRGNPNADVARILACIEQLASDPRPPGSEKLAGRDCYRVRQGSYRIIYEIRDQVLTVVVIRVAHRREVYRA